MENKYWMFHFQFKGYVFLPCASWKMRRGRMITWGNKLQNCFYLSVHTMGYMVPCLSMSWWYEVWKVLSHINSSLMQCHLKYELKFQFKLNDKKYIFYMIWNYLKWTDKRIFEPIKIWRYYKLAEAIKTLHWNITFTWKY